MPYYTPLCMVLIKNIYKGIDTIPYLVHNIVYIVNVKYAVDFKAETKM